MDTKFLIIGIHNGQPFQKEFHSPANLGQRLSAMLERGKVGDKLSIEIVTSELLNPTPAP